MSENKSIIKTGWNLDHSYLQLPDAFYTRLNPTPVSAPKLVIFNDHLALSLGLHADHLRGEEGAVIFSGNLLPEGAQPLAQAYAGHQFGHFTILGDGRAPLWTHTALIPCSALSITRGRYAYRNQPYMGAWNLARFAETLLPLLHPETPQAVTLAQDALAEYSTLYQRSWLDGMVAMLGLFTRETADESLVNELLNIMAYRSNIDV